jgi:branched-chain amino acid transport system permease protein
VGPADDGGTRVTRYLHAAVQLLGPVALVLAVGLASTTVSDANRIYFLSALVSVAIVVAIYVFVGNSGVLSFGQISFVAVGAFASGVMTIPLESKRGVLTELFPLLRDHTLGNVPSLLLAALLGGVFALVVGLPLMRLSGLAAGIATFALLEITHNILQQWTRIGPGATTLSLVPETTGALQATIGAVIAIAVALAYQRSRLGRQLRASREDPAAARAIGVHVHRQRLWAFGLSGALAGLAGALYVHMLGSITTEQVYLELTFLTLAMLVVGGLNSLWGAVVGALAVSSLDSFLGEAEQGIDVGFKLDLPTGTRLVILAAVMALVLVLRPSGLTGGREVGLPRIRRRSDTVRAEGSG